MSSQRGKIAMLALGALAIGAAWFGLRSARRAEASLAAITQERANLDEAIRRVQERVAAAETKRAGAQATLAALSSDKDVPAAPQKSPATSFPTPFEVLWADPKLQVLFLPSKRAELATSYGPFFRSLKLSPEQIAKFQEIAMKREELELDLSTTLRSDNAADRNAAATLKEQGQAEFITGLRKLLGETGERQFQEYERTLRVRTLVGRFAGEAALAGPPVTPDQGEQLTHLFTRASGTPQDGVSDAQVLGILSPAQLALFNKIESPGRGTLRFSEQFRNALSNAAKSNDNASRRAKPPGS